MEDLRTILNSHNPKSQDKGQGPPNPQELGPQATTSEIPDIFFDDILVHYKLTRVEILMLMFFYRITWCRPNLYKKYGISPMFTYTDIAGQLDISMDMLHQTIRRIEAFGFIETIRPGQYFVRKYFTPEHDQKFGQSYDNFL